jgi:hypothetical protein
MLQDGRFVVARAIVAITDLPQVCPRKLPKLASLSLGEALSLSHRSGRRVSPDKGGHNVQIAYRNGFSPGIDRSLRSCADRGRCNCAHAAMGRRGAQ